MGAHAGRAPIKRRCFLLPIMADNEKGPLSPLGLRQLVPQRDVRRMLWLTYLDTYDRLVVWHAHGATPVPSANAVAFGKHCAKHGYLKLLQHYARWFSREDLIDEISADAARHGHLPVLQWIDGFTGSFNAQCVFYAAVGGHENVLTWMRSRCNRNWNRLEADAWVGLAAGGHLHILEKLVYQPNDMIRGLDVTLAAKGGHLDVVQWLYAQKRFPSSDCAVMFNAATSGSLPLVQWLHSVMRDPWNKRICGVLALDNNLALLQWVRANGCPWWPQQQPQQQQQQTLGDNEAFWWAYANGAPKYYVHVE